MNVASRRQAAPGFWLVAPLLAVMALGFNLPLVLMLGKSVVGESGFTLQHFVEIFQVPAYLKVLFNTFRIALITAVCCVLLGYPLAYWLRRLPSRWQLLALAAVVIPFWVSILVRTYAWIVVLGNAGMVNRSLLGFGWIDSPIAFLYNELGVVIGTINVLLPFLVLPLFAAMLKIDERLLRAAETLGASNWTAFWRIFFPLSLPALAAGAILVFILTLGFFITPAILGGGRVPMVANMLDLLVNHLPNWELASTISTVLLGVTLVLFVMYLRLTTRKEEA
ncbi:ABC transporter permease [Variovorax ginsengisoli]|uniref:ABC transporter permease n=1 Tax=Variovorax ginsengisoli TaxID=363844 RepID=A0ABT8SEQ4_9BURK|nr:ABC transporter permease [Variovorax ginsengisoli]MDN8617472.1 ABC transporter permease [Variovorax ginsengisoli]MDO1536642.1 ABC transporter permease [Variovorax ginsengisoli]